MVLAMFEDKYTIGCQYVLSENHVGYLWQFFQRIGGIGKDKVKLLAA